jgi:hypothetical protein
LPIQAIARKMVVASTFTMIVPENFLRLMSAADRKRYAAGQMTSEEALVRAAARAEKDEHNLYIAWLHSHDIEFFHSRMDRKVSGTIGWPDFTVIHGNRCLLGEFKVYGNKISQVQAERFDRLLRNGTEVAIWSSADEAIRKTRGWLWEHFRLHWAEPQ